MAVPFLHLLLLLLLLLFLVPLFLAETTSSPYLSPSTFLPGYQKMLKSFKIFAYPTPPKDPAALVEASSSAALFDASLLRSPFLTSDPHRAHLFYLSFPSEEPRSIARFLRAIRSQYPFWNRTLGADHFFRSIDGLGIESDRNLVELKKNSIQISPFPTAPGRFVPHKDLTLPSLMFQLADLPIPSAKPSKFFAFYDGAPRSPVISPILDELRRIPDFLINSWPSNPVSRLGTMSVSRFCLFYYDRDRPRRDLAIGDALAMGCVPVVISGCPILDLPFSDVLRWTDIALFVGLHGGAGEVRRAMNRTCGETYERMRVAGGKASIHFKLSTGPRPFDLFHTVIYQLWLRRHTIRYRRYNEL
ncbi:probable glycosyltransferase At5g03795 isoform X1 [Phoenix dactylifera]|uniref:Probable glycosyltransferase At5g03795 isoform X1 n=1 Tax=Phoenix dactylifera TaxID=42345 RepID=A0A8B9A306_PHODC|nr:probable glycosyltransferase At5g03795 isoform X1 [Phoenix dactylifera]XP_038980024.1 probable glycosyltransferase At5g03795 isoform X1 [Phoenix dactylifera]XP_038980025.1 probable glycosyltransferase At5g03795 isoform X1 [Phoenix dactylifera]XP_038980026.1 probable glycosyltransferase At5g03795 isoform X1 [Phoenix dactylifera]XP_038980027.1 probable glycosyltransferase At5g03795 isoform X1 [Phoenix dactylifera]XP_038980028.1 probable glycosyltransferase At5g03795 isoform X1 [Phoenix dactyl